MVSTAYAQELKQFGGKGHNLQILQRGNFLVPETNFAGEVDLKSLSDKHLYIVRSSAAMEDSSSQTAAGKYDSILGVHKEDLESAINQVRSRYPTGSVVLQPDLTSEMQFSGVIYTNLNGEMIISIGDRNQVQEIVQGKPAKTEITIRGRERMMKGEPLSPQLVTELEELARRTENYFGIPLDLEFGVLTEPILLQARPLPNPTDEAIREHERRRLEPLTAREKQLGLEELVLGVGNYREILGNTNATELSVSTFNYIFSGDGAVLGAMQLGRNELGYDTGTEIFPWVIMFGGKVYYNFAGDALQFRPKGITQDELIEVINGLYIPLARANPDLLNYPELQLYIQFPEQAKQVGLNPEPFQALAEKNRKAMREISQPGEPPTKKIAGEYLRAEDYLGEIQSALDEIRTGSAREYVKAARLAFFALEDIRIQLEKLQNESPADFKEIAKLYGKSTPAELRDALAYDESILSFELPERDEYQYLGSFELTQPRGFPPQRHFKKGREIPVAEISDLVKITRTVLEHREKVKFFLFRDYDYLKQLYDRLGQLTGFDQELFNLDQKELGLALTEPTLAQYRIELRKRLREKELFPDPIFGEDLEKKTERNYSKELRLIFGTLPPSGFKAKMGETGYLVNSVDQTVSIPRQTTIVFVEENVRPGSHLFTVLSDYGLPVVAVPSAQMKQLAAKEVEIQYKDGKVSILALGES